MTHLNKFQKMIVETANRMGLDNAARWLYLVGQHNINTLELQIGKYQSGCNLMILATIDGQRLGIGSDCTIKDLMAIDDYYKTAYLTPAHREAIKTVINKNAKVILEEITEV